MRKVAIGIFLNCVIVWPVYVGCMMTLNTIPALIPLYILFGATLEGMFSYILYMLIKDEYFRYK